MKGNIEELCLVAVPFCQLGAQLWWAWCSLCWILAAQGNLVCAEEQFAWEELFLPWGIPSSYWMLDHESAHHRQLKYQSVLPLPALPAAHPVDRIRKILWQTLPVAKRIQLCVYLEGLLCRFTRPNCNQVGPSHAAETLQMQRISHWDCGDRIILWRQKGKTSSLVLHNNSKTD